MKRTEYLNNEAYNIGYADGQKDVINKACKWLLANRLNYDYLNLHGDVYDASLVKDFKKAMEE